MSFNTGPNIGDLNRRVALRRDTGSTKNSVGESISNWTTIATVWAQYTPVSDNEKMLASEQFSTIQGRFVMRYAALWANINAKDQLTMDGKDWNVLGVKEIERRRWLEITAGTRDD